MQTSTNAGASTARSAHKEVFDLSLMKEKSLPVKTALFSKHEYSNISSPCLDDSSVSTIGSNTSGLHSTGGSTHRRSLFSKYWGKNGESSYSATSPPPTAIIEIADDQLSQEEEEQAVDQHEGSPIHTVRRSLFSPATRRSVSLNCLDESFETASATSSLSKNGRSRHKSEGELMAVGRKNKKQTVSCLRESRFSFSKRGSLSGSERRSSVCSESSVQFDMESTEVRHFVKPVEVYAEDGWTNYFK